MQLLDLRMRVCGAELRSAGMVGVNTYPEHRNRGHARFMLERSLDVSRVRGFHISTLDGVPGMYQRWGYATTMPEVTITLLTRHAEAAHRRHRTRRARSADWPAVARIYNAATAGLDGSRVRDPRRWSGPRQGSWWDLLDTVTVVTLDGRDRVSGYLVLDDVQDEVMVTDAQFRHVNVAETLLWVAARAALKRRVERIRFQLHPRLGFGAYLCSHDVAIETTRPVGRRQMARLLDQDAVLGAVAPTLRARARNYDGAVPGVLTFATDLGATDIRLSTGSDVRTVRLPQHRLVQLLFGYLSADQVAHSSSVRIAGRDLALLDALFPHGDAYCYWPDRY